jgi:hypothetical protein
MKASQAWSASMRAACLAAQLHPSMKASLSGPLCFASGYSRDAAGADTPGDRRHGGPCARAPTAPRTPCVTGVAAFWEPSQLSYPSLIPYVAPAQAGLEPALASEAALGGGGAEAIASAPAPEPDEAPRAEDSHHLLAPHVRADGGERADAGAAAAGAAAPGPDARAPAQAPGSAAAGGVRQAVADLLI